LGLGHLQKPGGFGWHTTKGKCFALRRRVMKKWDMMAFDFLSNNHCHINCTDPVELKEFGEIAVKEANSYFSYLVDAKKRLDIGTRCITEKGHGIAFWVNNEISQVDLKYFLLNIAISRNWLPYAGDGEGKRFIRYNE
jgi:hypothetical protein